MVFGKAEGEMIATVTLNPAVDKTLSVSRVILGNVNRMDEVHNMAGGKGINVAHVLKQFGYETKALGFVGGYTGEFIENSVEAMGVVNAFTHVAGNTRTSTNVIGEDGYITELLEPGPQISDNEKEEFLKSYKEQIKNCEMVILSGSAPRGINSDFYAELISAASSENVKILLDASGENLKSGMQAKPFMIKPNMMELQTLMGRKIQGMHEVCEAAVSLVKDGIPNVLVSMGSKGILYAKDENQSTGVYYVPAPRIRVVNSVGSGDCAVAAFAMSFLEGLNPEETVKRCVAVSVANALSLENGEIDKDRVEEIKKSISLCNIE